MTTPESVHASAVASPRICHSWTVDEPVSMLLEELTFPPHGWVVHIFIPIASVLFRWRCSRHKMGRVIGVEVDAPGAEDARVGQGLDVWEEGSRWGKSSSVKSSVPI